MKPSIQIMEQKQQLEQAVQQALDLAKQATDAAEVAVSKTTGISASTRYGEVESVEFNSDGAWGITVYIQNRKGSASSSDTNPDSIKRTVQAAIEIASYTSSDPYADIADKNLLAWDPPDLDLFHPVELSPEQAVALAAATERQALAFDPSIVNSEGATVNSHASLHIFGNSHGMLNSYCSSRYSLSASVIAEQAGQMERDYAYTVARRFSDLASAEWVAEETARRTLARLGANQLPTMVAPVIFSAEIASSLFAHLAGAISGNNVYRGSTFLLNHLGKAIFPEWLSITEHPHLLRGLASSPFDNEGVRTQENTIIANGKLQTWLLNGYAARKLALQSTGHAGGIHNWRLAGQAGSFEHLLKTMGSGLVVTELMGQGVSLMTGDYSRGAAGFWVENGEIQYPVSGVTIAGNLGDMWRNIVAVANDTELRTNIQSGSVLISEMKIAGH